MFDNFSLQDLCNIIILVSAVIIAIKNIYGFFKKPVDKIQDHVNEKEEKHIIEVINNTLPQLLKEKNEPILDAIQELKDMSEAQTQQMKDLS